MAQDIKVALTLDNKQFNSALKQSEKNVKGLKTSTAGTTTSVQGLVGAFQAFIAIGAVREIVRLSDEFTSLNNRLKAVTASEVEAATALRLVQQVASETRSDLSSVASLFADITIASEELGLSQERVAGITKVFSQSLKVSGADAGTAAGAIRQFGQALASGVLRGDEFNSINEANSKFMGELAKALGVTRGELRELASQGKITSEIMIDATEKMASTVERDFQKTTGTIADSFTNLRNVILGTVGEIGDTSGGMNSLANAVNDLAAALESLKPVISIVGTLLGFLGSLVIILAKFRIFTAIFKGFGDSIFGVTKKAGGLGATFMTIARGGKEATAVLAQQGPIMKTLGGLVAWFSNSLRGLISQIKLLGSAQGWKNFFKNSLNPFKGLTMQTLTFTGVLKGLAKGLLAIGRRFLIFTLVYDLVKLATKALAGLVDAFGRLFGLDLGWFTAVNGFFNSISDAIDKAFLKVGNFLSEWLNLKKEVEDIDTEGAVNQINEITEQLNLQLEAQKMLREENKRLQKSYDDFYKDLFEGARDSVEETNNVTRAVEYLLNSGLQYSQPKVWAKMMEELGYTVDGVTQESVDLAEAAIEAGKAFAKLNKELNADFSMDDLEFDLEMFNLSEVEQRVAQAMRSLDKTFADNKIDLQEFIDTEGLDASVKADAQAVLDNWDKLVEGAKSTAEALTRSIFSKEQDEAFKDFRESISSADTFDALEALKLRLTELATQGDITATQLANGMRLINEAIASLDAGEGVKQTLKELAESFTPFQMAVDATNAVWGNMSSAIDDLVDNGKASFSDLAKSIVKDLVKMIMKAYLFNAIMGLGGKLGFDMSFMKREKGGSVSQNTPYMVGEKGPELFVPSSAGSIVPNNALMEGASSGPVTNNYITNNIQALDSKSVAQVFAENRESLLGTVEYARKETAYGV
jgi:tape measure domain-containing protein